MMYLYLYLRNLLTRDDEGQDLAEYALLIALIAIVVIVAVTALGGKLTTIFTAITDRLVVAPAPQ